MSNDLVPKSDGLPVHDERRAHRKRRKCDRYLLDQTERSFTVIDPTDMVPGKSLLEIASQNCTIQSSKALDPDVDITFKLKIHEKIFNVSGSIKNITSLPNGNTRYGVQFHQQIQDPKLFLQKKLFRTRRGPVEIFGFAKRFSSRLMEWKSQEYYHYHRRESDIPTNKIIDFTSNDYLSLSRNPKIRKAAQDALIDHGLGTAGPSIFAGDLALHDKLSKTIAAIKKTESCLLCPSGFTANSGIFTGLITVPGTLIFLDEKDHASIFHGALGSKGKIKIFRHNDLEHLEKLLNQYERTAVKVICVDGLYSMDGDIAPLDKIYELAQEYNASLWVDDAHSFGIFGEKGAGIEDHFGLAGKIDIVTGSLSKTLGGFGGYVCAPKAVTDFLDHLGREFVYTTTLPAAICAGLLEGIRIMQEESDGARGNLWINSRYLKESLLRNDFPVGPTESPIVPVIFGHEDVSQRYAQELYAMGIDINSVTRPAVRRDESRLRITVRSDHSLEQLDHLVQSMCAVRENININPHAKRPGSVKGSIMNCRIENS